MKIVELFGCHEVEGVAYLRADYSIECYTSQWNAMAAYASVFLIAYVVGFPAFVTSRLWSYRHELQAQAHGAGQVCKLAPKGLLLGFLLDDYRLKLPCYMWEAEEMIRKLLLSVIGAFWASKSVSCIATALLVSVFPASTVTQIDKVHCVALGTQPPAFALLSAPPRPLHPF